ncbi:rho guanine nucleotide exchange factor 25 isoform X1 [Drosophila takahashii]|uniref:rho guanine nucleotide exchange factor 25 isoform X1 n=1 Tax=Drosophila takahashii TaxID=29030 RepID=UPI001CF8581E|nr:rho guanine nucleotide exchange factor 25 [Drosophila takahashii]
MELTIFTLNWFDVISVALTFLVIFLVQVLNVYLHILDDKCDSNGKSIDVVDKAPAKECPILEGHIPGSPISTTPPPKSPTSANGKLEKQISLLDNDSGISLGSINTCSTTAANSSPTHRTHNGFHSFPSHTLSFETLGDEYHEDEDTLSLENLFPCDQTEIYASKKISFIIDELIQTEVNYVNNLKKGMVNYGKLKDVEDLPEGLSGESKQKLLLGNIEEILELHEQEILPLMLRNQRDLKGLFDEFAVHFEKNHFYCYVSFTMGKKSSMQLRQDNRMWLQAYQTQIKDKLGIDSFLVQPIQRLTRYPLLLQQFISEFYKSGISCKPVLTAVCKLETRMRRALDVVNQAEEIPNIEELNELDLLQLGNFRRSTEFDAQHFPTRKKYRSKVFLFDRSLVCTEVRKKRLAYRQHYNWEHVELQRPLDSASSNANKIINLLVKQQEGGAGSGSSGSSKKEEYSFVATEAAVVKQWLQATHKIIEIARNEHARRNTFSLPMDLVLGVVLAIWLIWQYL